MRAHFPDIRTLSQKTPREQSRTCCGMGQSDTVDGKIFFEPLNIGTPNPVSRSGFAYLPSENIAATYASFSYTTRR